MAQQRINAALLGRVFNSTSTPIYVLDDALVVIFVNRACAEWLGDEALSLVGCPCTWKSTPEPSGPASLCGSLCPPPTVLAGQESSVAIVPAVAAPPDGPDLARQVRFVPLMTGQGGAVAVVAMVEGPPRPIEPGSAPMADSALAMHEQIRHFRRKMGQRFRAERLIGQSSAMRRARRQVELAIASKASVLLVGPAGSGRQHVAAAIHYGGDRQQAGSLIPLDCAVLSAEWVESTVAALASGNPLGSAAAQSTLQLNHVDRLPGEVQTSLFSLLAGRGVSLRLVATAEESLLEMANRGQFHGELASLLSTLVIELPPLCQRREDLPLLAQLFLEEENARGGKQVAGIAPEALDRLDGYAWPGNLDELAAAMAESHRRAAGGEVRAEDLPNRLRFAEKAAAHPRRVEETIVLDEFLAGVEKELIERALARSKGNKAKASRLLGLTRPRLYRRMVQLGLEKEPMPSGGRHSVPSHSPLEEEPQEPIPLDDGEKTAADEPRP